MMPILQLKALPHLLLQLTDELAGHLPVAGLVVHGQLVGQGRDQGVELDGLVPPDPRPHLSSLLSI